MLFAITLMLSPAHAGPECASQQTADASTDTKVEASPMLDVAGVEAAIAKGAVPVDANGDDTRKEFGVIPGAVLLTSYKSIEGLPEDKASELVFYCARDECTASDKAATLARDAGYTNTSIFKAGIKGWTEAGKKVQTSPQG